MTSLVLNASSSLIVTDKNSDFSGEKTDGLYKNPQSMPLSSGLSFQIILYLPFLSILLLTKSSSTVLFSISAKPITAGNSGLPKEVITFARSFIFLLYFSVFQLNDAEGRKSSSFFEGSFIVSNKFSTL